MSAIHVIERILIVAILLLAVLQLGGMTVRADLGRQPARIGIEAPQQGLSERLCREIGSPHSNGEACHHILRMVH